MASMLPCHTLSTLISSCIIIALKIKFNMISVLHPTLSLLADSEIGSPGQNCILPTFDITSASELTKTEETHEVPEINHLKANFARNLMILSTSKYYNRFVSY